MFWTLVRLAYSKHEHFILFSCVIQCSLQQLNLRLTSLSVVHNLHTYFLWARKRHFYLGLMMTSCWCPFLMIILTNIFKLICCWKFHVKKVIRTCRNCMNISVCIYSKNYGLLWSFRCLRIQYNWRVSKFKTIISVIIIILIELKQQRSVLSIYN